MATFEIDPATSGVADFTTRVSGLDIAIVDDSGVPAIKIERLAGSTGFFSYDPAGTATNAQIVTRSRHSSAATNGNYALSVARLDPSFDLYAGGVRATQSNTLINYVDGSVAGLASVDIGINSTAYAWQRFEVTGSTLRVRRWTGTPADEPATWDSEVTDTGVTSAGYVGIGARNINAGDSSYYAWIGIGTDGDTAPTGSGPAPTITNINTTNEFTPGETNNLNGTNLSTTGGSIVINGETQTITNRTATAITFTGVRGGNPYNTDLTLTYTDADSNTVTQTVQQVPAVGFAVTAASPNTTDPASLWSGLVDTSTGNPVTVVDGDQALVTDPNSLGNLAVTPAGEIIADTEGNFVVQFWRASEGVWGGDQTVTFEVPSDPDPAPEPTDLDAKKKQNKRRRYTANFFGAWRNRFIGGQDE